MKSLEYTLEIYTQKQSGQKKPKKHEPKIVNSISILQVEKPFQSHLCDEHSCSFSICSLSLSIGPPSSPFVITIVTFHLTPWCSEMKEKE